MLFLGLLTHSLLIQILSCIMQSSFNCRFSQFYAHTAYLKMKGLCALCGNSTQKYQLLLLLLATQIFLGNFIDNIKAEKNVAFWRTMMLVSGMR